MKYFFASVIFSITFITQDTFAWGGRGHDTICQSAVFLVKNKTLKDFLRNKPNMMGHLCNIPDTYWRGLAPEQTKEGNATHYIESEALGIPLKDMPLDMKALIEKYTGTEDKLNPGSKIRSLPHEIGTNWWRANQLFEMSIVEGKKLKDHKAPGNSKEEQSEDHPYDNHLYNMITYMGLLGHFVGDNGQPLHTNADYDGYETGHGGIHAYYEDLCVSYFDEDLSVKIVAKAKTIEKNSKLNAFTQQKTVLENMRALAVASNNEVKDLFKADPIITKSILKEEKGMKIKTPAVRKSPEQGQKAFANFIVTEMARSALLLAKMWDDIYVEIGKPDFKAYKSYRYPLTPDFVMPDYYEIKATSKK
ncbi:MAG: hypothetical protein H7235_00310 [Bdellovibrionaceae bacterium]|nr:hypothetical protein [Pseudobdellovibrionaceae bacterium]